MPVFFYWYGDRRVLHSFPTRRSSDLTLSLSIEAMAALFGLPMMTNGNLSLWRSSIRSSSSDRKSTRLNSSHLGISYAVFCLKKKRQRQEEQLEYTHTGGDASTMSRAR